MLLEITSLVPVISSVGAALASNGSALFSRQSFKANRPVQEASGRTYPCMEVIADPEGFRGADREAFTIGCLMSSLKYSGSQIVVRQDGWGQFAPKLAPLPRGGFVAVYEAGPESGTDTDIKGRIFNDDGSPRGSEFTINSTTSGYQDRPSVLFSKTGGLS